MEIKIHKIVLCMPQELKILQNNKNILLFYNLNFQALKKNKLRKVKKTMLLYEDYPKLLNIDMRVKYKLKMLHLTILLFLLSESELLSIYKIVMAKKVILQKNLISKILFEIQL